jgi:hypothetical protein
MKRRDRTPCGKGRQRGISLIGWLILLILVGGWVYGAIRVVPAYIEDGEIGTTLKGVRNDARTLPIQDIQRELVDQLNINSIDDVKVSEFKFTEDGGKLTISINHPIEKSFIGNLSFVIHSRHSITVTRGGGSG